MLAVPPCCDRHASKIGARGCMRRAARDGRATSAANGACAAIVAMNGVYLLGSTGLKIKVPPGECPSTPVQSASPVVSSRLGTPARLATSPTSSQVGTPVRPGDGVQVVDPQHRFQQQAAEAIRKQREAGGPEFEVVEEEDKFESR